MEIFYHSKFLKKFKKLNKDIQSLAIEKEEFFKNDPFDSRLKTHKLSGRFEGFYSFSVNHSYRIIFTFDKKDIVSFHVIGNHDIYES